MAMPRPRPPIPKNHKIRTISFAPKHEHLSCKTDTQTRKRRAGKETSPDQFLVDSHFADLPRTPTPSFFAPTFPLIYPPASTPDNPAPPPVRLPNNPPMYSSPTPRSLHLTEKHTFMNSAPPKSSFPLKVFEVKTI